jgi:ankyrin repeat protein
MARKQPKKRSRPGVDEYGRTPLHYAAGDGDAGAAQQLLAAGADPNLQDDDGWSPLHFAAQASSAPVAQLLLAAGAQVDSRDSWGNTPLAKAVFNSRGDGSLILVLRAAGANPTALNHHGVSPLSLARTIANYDVAQFFSDLPGDGAA